MSGVWRRVSRLDDPIVSLAEAKRQTNTIDFDDDDLVLSALCDVVTRHLDLGEGVTRRPLLTQTWQMTAPAPICSDALLQARLRSLPHSRGFYIDQAPLQAIEKLEALQSGVYVEIPSADYVTRPLLGEATWLRMKDGVAWPEADRDEAAWRVTARLGYGATPDTVPAPLRHAALMLLAHMYQNRESVSGWGSNLAETPMAFEALVGPYRTIEL